MKLVNCVCSERRGSFSLQFDLKSLSFKQTHRAKETFKGGFIHWRFVVVIMKLVNCVCSKGRGRFSLQFDNLIFLVSSSPSKSWLMAHNSSSWWWPTTSQPTKKPMFLLEGYCMFVCLFKGSVIVLHGCLMNQIRICSVPQSHTSYSTSRRVYYRMWTWIQWWILNSIDLSCCP